VTYKDAYYGWERDNTHVFGHRVIAAYVAELEAELAALKDVITVLAEMAAEAADPMQPNAPPADWISEAKRRVASFPVARAEEGGE